MALPPNFIGSMTLKALLEDPNLKNPPIVQQQSSDLKIKKEGSTDSPRYNYGSAFLGPNLWDKTYDNIDFNLEYMDLDEFLSENEIPAANTNGMSDIALSQPKTPPITNGPPLTPTSSPRQFLRTPPVSPRQFLTASPPMPASPLASTAVVSPTATAYTHAFTHHIEQHTGNKSPSPPVSPLQVDFHVSDQDLALTCAPEYSPYSSSLGHQHWSRAESEPKQSYGTEFDPRKRNFTDEELKPQPIMKKSKKVFVPEDLKDDRYWARRQKNNYAAKRSRDARRVKENQIALRAAFLEKENKCLRDEMAKLKKENIKLKSRLSNYEPLEENST